MSEDYKDDADVQQELWQVVCTRNTPYDGEVRHTKWFVKEDNALSYADWVRDGRGEVLSIRKYQLVLEGGSK